jgi:hypothetical protein
VEINAMVDNVAKYGYNSDPRVNHGLGGLYINWRYGTNPEVANLASAQQLAPRNAHDPLTDLRYLHDLLVLRTLEPGNSTIVSEIRRYTPIVESEYSGTHDQRGWIFDELIDMARLSKDAVFLRAARSLAEFIDGTEYHPASGAIYTVSLTAPLGAYRTDLAIADACALIEAGAEFKQPQWTSDGKRALDFIYAHAYSPSAQTFLMGMDNVLNADGSINPVESVARHRFRNEKIDGGAIKLGEVGQIAISLLHAYSASGDVSLRTRAIDYLRPFTGQVNSLGLWDPTNLGYYAQVSFNGTSPANPGSPRVNTRYKESGRQALMLQAFHLADVLSNGAAGFQQMETAMLTVVVDKAYYAPGHGILYEMTPDWKPVKPELTWVTSEAIGITIQALLSLVRSKPW